MIQWIGIYFIGLIICIALENNFMSLEKESKTKYKKLKELVESRRKQLEPYVRRVRLVNEFNNLRIKCEDLKPCMRRFEKKIVRIVKKVDSEKYNSMYEKLCAIFPTCKISKGKINRKNRNIRDNYILEDDPEVIIHDCDRLLDSVRNRNSKRFLLCAILAYPIPVIVITAIVSTDNFLGLLFSTIIIAVVFTIVIIIIDSIIFMVTGSDLMLYYMFYVAFNVIFDGNGKILVRIEQGLAAAVRAICNVLIFIVSGVVLVRMGIICFHNSDYAWSLVHDNASWILWIEICFSVYVISRLSYKSGEISYMSQGIAILEGKIKSGDISKKERMIETDNDKLEEELIENIAGNIADINITVNKYSNMREGGNRERRNEEIMTAYWDYRFLEELLEQNITKADINRMNMDAVKHMSKKIANWTEFQQRM